MALTKAERQRNSAEALAEQKRREWATSQHAEQMIYHAHETLDSVREEMVQYLRSVPSGDPSARLAEAIRRVAAIVDQLVEASR